MIIVKYYTDADGNSSFEFSKIFYCKMLGTVAFV
jgi:hypothetical protein